MTTKMFLCAMSQKGSLILIPIPIADNSNSHLPPNTFNTLKNITHFVVENSRTSRRFIKSILPDTVIENLNFIEINKHDGTDFKQITQWLKEGNNIGLMSEAGCPGIADPGAEIVAHAQNLDIKVIPLVGPNSIILALMASGLNGQSFCFNGYLPIKEPNRSQKIKQLEHLSKKENQTQIFIETPYRNNQIFQDLLKSCNAQTKICIAQNITGANEWIKTKTASEWEKSIPNLAKEPTVFLLLA